MDDDVTTSDSAPPTEERPTRRGMLASVLMWGGLAAGYGAGLLHFFRFLVPLGRKQKFREMIVGNVDALPEGSTRMMADPDGRKFVLARTGPDPQKDILALSATCPHLGCNVHWDSKAGIFLCPCHQGEFDRRGKAIGGPPAEMGESGNLQRYEVRVRGKIVFAMVKDRTDVIG